MKIVRAIFIDGGKNPISEVIKFATSSRFSHTAIGFDDCIIEAVAEGVVKTENGHYENSEELEILVSDEQYDSIREFAESLIGKKYGFDDCIIGGVHDVFGDGAAKVIRFIDSEDSIDCSGTWTTVAKHEFPSFAAGHVAAEITPIDAYSYTLEMMEDMRR